MNLPKTSAGKSTDLHARRRWRLHWAAILAAGLFIIVFYVLSSTILNLQQRIVDVTNETRDAMVPKQLAQLRTVRNLEMLRHFGSLAAKATDPTVGQDAAFLASMAALIPLIEGDTSTESLVTDANRLIRDIAAREADPAQWPAMEDRLTQRADDISADLGHMTLQRATDIRDDSLLVRNVAVSMFWLFTASMFMMLVFGIFVVTDIRSKQQLFSEASHDFRQRLHGMQLLINSAQRIRLQGGADIVLRLKAINADLQRYLENFLELARLDAGMRSHKPKNNPISLQSVFQKLEFQFEDIARYHETDIKFRNTSFICHADEQLLLRILENLIANALKFARTRVLIAGRRRDGVIEVCVFDDGPGMPDFQKRNLWKAFVQGEGRADATFDRGFGLGMSIVMRCASLLRAKVQVRTVAGRGSTVRVGIPIRG